MKVSELTGALLDFWVAKAEGKNLMADGDGGWFDENGFEYSPSTEWSDGGPIIERVGISTGPVASGWLACDKDVNVRCEGDSLLIAAMRCYVTCRCYELEDDSQTN